MFLFRNRPNARIRYKNMYTNNITILIFREITRLQYTSIIYETNNPAGVKSHVNSLKIVMLKKRYCIVSSTLEQFVKFLVNVNICNFEYPNCMFCSGSEF